MPPAAALTIAFATGANWYALAAVIFLMALVLAAWWVIERRSSRHKRDRVPRR